MYRERIMAVQQLFKKDFQGMLVTETKNIRYLCGFSGSTGVLLLTKKGAFFFTDFRYQEQSAREIADLAEIVIVKQGLLKSALEKAGKARIKKLAVEKSISLQHFIMLQEEFKNELIPVAGIVEELRKAKQDEEVKKLKKAFAIADDSFAKLMKVIKPGMTEVEVAAHLEFFMKSAGSDEPSFSTIIASGPNSACPHAQPSTRKLKKGEMVKIDFGAVFQGYHSDMTRTIFLGKASEKFKKIYSIVHKAQEKAIRTLAAGVVCKDVDAAARAVIDAAGYKENFGHGLGHSLGLEVHEAPSLSPKCEDIIEPGMAFTIEPGIYLPGWGGIRIEDVFIVNKQGLLRLTKTSNDLLEI